LRALDTWLILCRHFEGKRVGFFLAIKDLEGRVRHAQIRSEHIVEMDAYIVLITAMVTIGTSKAYPIQHKFHSALALV
jgi:hypothetical protein